ncbi:hypothetical protein [Streptomyces violaceusniger]|uniref:DUF8108 domain-containing protein n=1 Tax=Streptomyces violaceusniger (strain Tu 4113) TaxID=653045 RepID=G2PHM3_STRV4|nr:hypothetical protein [Streptomyces violaceusniger]AEM88824.1 hypothetical protein Strvi_0047 [Streptomyces violaceusniger Tu 4113]
MTTPRPHIPQQPSSYVPPNIVISNTVAPSVSASSSAAAAAVGGYGPLMRKRRQSFWAHFWLAIFTAGMGNVVYAWWISRWNDKRGLY